jgi:2'-5' RNA ligase
MSRLFIALPIPDEIAAIVLPLQTGILGARFSPRANLHITLRFIGTVAPDMSRDLKKALAQIVQSPIELSLEGTEVFGGEKPHSLHLKLAHSAALFALREKCEMVCRNLGLEPDLREYVPHLTLAYLKEIDDVEMAGYKASHMEFKSPKWQAENFNLYSSTVGNGPSKYELMAKFSLV